MQPIFSVALLTIANIQKYPNCSSIDIDSLTINICLMLLGLIMVFAGANWSVKAVEKIATLMGISETFIAILIVAVGTSLPEIFTSISAMKKGKQDIAVGNLI